jgi:hypothetical protein
MIPASYTTLAAAVLVAGGLLTCFAGYRLFRVVLGLYGFFLGARVASSMFDPGNTFVLALACVVGGLLGAVVMIFAYFVGVGLVGAGLAALALNFAWRLIGGSPPTIVLVIVCVVGAVLALNAVRYVVVIGTAIAGAWTVVIGGLALTGDPSALKAASAPGVWVVYPTNLLPPAWWVTGLWFLLAIAGVVVSCRRHRRRKRKRRRRKRRSRRALAAVVEASSQMATFSRHATVDWTGTIMDGAGTATGTGAFSLRCRSRGASATRPGQRAPRSSLPPRTPRATRWSSRARSARERLDQGHVRHLP